MSLSCPVCRAENHTGPNCRRCKADLSLLYQLEATRDRQMAEARAHLAAGRWRAARTCALAAQHLRRDEASNRLAAVTALLCGDFDSALREYQERDVEGQPSR